MAIQRSSPAMRTRTARRAASSCSSQCGSAPRASASAVVRSPSIRSRSAVPSTSRTCRSSGSRCSSASISVERVGVDQLAQLGLAEQLGEQRRVDGQRGRASFGQRRVALVQEGGDVAEQQRPGVGAGLRRLDLDDADLARGEPAHQGDQARHVEDVLQALAHRLEHDRERGVAAGHREQLGRALPLLPQRSALARAAPGQQQRPAGALAEPRGEQRRAADLAGDDRLDLVRVEHARDRPGGSRHSVSGSRSTMPSSECIACTSTP